MVNGYNQIEQAPHYEDYVSLKKYIWSQQAIKYKNLRVSQFIYNQDGTDTIVEISEKAGETIADIGKTAETWIAQISAYAEDVVVTLTWTNTSGVSATSTVTLTDANETAFTTPITTGYLATACSIDIVNPGGVTVKVGVTGVATPVATIAAGATAAMEAGLSGTGRITLAQKTDQVGTDGGKDAYLAYLDPWGTIKYGFATLSAADTSTEVVWYEASSAYVATTILVKDFYRMRSFTSEIVTADELLLVAPGGATVYGVIIAASHFSGHSRYTCPTGRSAWFGRFRTSTSVATRIVTDLTITYTPYGHTDEHTIVIALDGIVSQDPLFRLAANTEIKFQIIGNHTDNTFDFQILEAEDL